jgi:hypothetical protein
LDRWVEVTKSAANYPQLLFGATLKNPHRLLIFYCVGCSTNAMFALLFEVIRNTTRIMKSIFVLSIVVFIAFECSGQKKDSRANFVDGVMVTTAGDSVKGQINDELWYFTPLFIEFKSTDGAVKKYQPTEVRAFVTKDRMYRSYLVSYDSTVDIADELSTSPLPALKSAHLYLKVLVAGKKSLLEYRDNNRRLFFIEFDNKAEQLVDHPFLYKYTTNENVVRTTSREFIGQLQRYLADCKNFNVSTKLRYSRENLKTLFQKYNSCVGQSKDFDHEAKSKFILEAVGGVAYESYLNFSKGMGGEGGLLFGVSPSNKLYKTTYFIELMYNQFPNQSRPHLTLNPFLGYGNYAQTVQSSIFRISWGFRNRIARSKSFYTVAASYTYFAGTYSDGVNFFNDKDQFNQNLGIAAGLGMWVTKWSAIGARCDFDLGAPINSAVGRYTAFQITYSLRLIAR